MDMEIDEIADGVQSLSQQWPCREHSIRQLCALLSRDLANPSTIVVHGPKATGKSSIVKAVLEQENIPSTIIPGQECITGRHLLERTVAAVREALPAEGRFDSSTVYNGRCENLAALSVHLQRLMEGQDKFVLVFDGIDRQREAQPTLLPALSRMGEQIANLTVILIVRHPSPRFLHQAGVPHISFPPYSRNESLRIISQDPPLIFTEPTAPELEYDDEIHLEDRNWLWPRFCAAVWDSVGQSSARNLTAFREVCTELWRPFVAPIVKGDFGTRDFSRLLVAQRRLFQDESVLTASIVPLAAVKSRSSKNGQDLPYYAKWILTAAYLASYNPAKSDHIYFMKSSERRKKKGGGARAGAGRPSQKRKVPRHLLAPSAFTFDRLLSILHAILPDTLRTTLDISTQISTLTNLRLLVRTSRFDDPLEPGAKWRVGAAVTWDHAQALSRTLDFALLDYMAE